jgi:hypothetical protein
MNSSVLNPTVTSTDAVPLLTAEEFVSRYDGQNVELAKGIVEALDMPKSGLQWRNKRA